MANKTFEDLAKELGYRTFADMKTTVGKGSNFTLSSFFKNKKNPSSPTKESQDGSISSDIIPFLNIIAKNSLALPGMARDMNVLRQNIVALVKLKSKEAITKADKFFQTEDKREADLEAARKEQTSPKQEKEAKPKKEKTEKDGGTDTIFDVLWDFITKTIGGLVIGLGIAFAKVFDIGKIISDIADALNPLPMIEKFFKSVEEGWKELTETDIIKETLIKGFGKFLEFITGGLFGEKELRKSLDDLKEYIAPMIDVIGETFEKIVGWLRDNIGWDPFTIPLSKANEYLPDWAKKFSLPDIHIPGFRPFKKSEETPTVTSTGGTLPSKPPSSFEQSAYDESGGGSIMDAAGTAPTKEPTKRTQEGKVKRAPQNVAKEAEKDKRSAVEFLKNQTGVVYDPNSPTQFADVKTGKPIDETSVRERIVDMKGNPDKILSLIKGTTPTTTTSAGTADSTSMTTTSAGTADSTSMSTPTGGATSASAATGKSVSPSAETSSPSSSSGAALSQASSDVAEGQRMDSAADAGVYVDAKTTNNKVSSTGKKAKQTASAYNNQFIDSYYAVY